MSRYNQGKQFDTFPLHSDSNKQKTKKKTTKNDTSVGAEFTKKNKGNLRREEDGPSVEDIERSKQEREHNYKN